MGRHATERVVGVHVTQLFSFPSGDPAEFADLTEAVPAVATVALILFSYNIANGLTAGLVLYPVFKVLAGRWRELSGGAVALGLLCLSYFVFGLPH